jgi:uncharacterized protein (DUF2344 family)
LFFSRTPHGGQISVDFSGFLFTMGCKPMIRMAVAHALAVGLVACLQAKLWLN